jgi:hypothetical protein
LHFAITVAINNTQFSYRPQITGFEKLARLFHIKPYNPIYPVLSSVFAEELVNHQVDHFFYPKAAGITCNGGAGSFAAWQD